MSLLAARADFEPADEAEGAAALYWEPGNAAGQTGYRQFPEFQARVDQLKGRFAPNGQKLAVWGCGFGYLVQLAVAAGYDAFGFDASSYAVARGKQAIPSVAARLFVRDALNAADMTPARRDAGLQGAQRFALLVTDDLLTCMADAEVAACLPLLRGICSSNLGHVVTPSDLAGTQPDPRLNWKTAAQWKALLSPPDLVLDQRGNPA